MRTLLTSLFLICAFYVSAQKATGIHHKAILIDTHNDILSEVVEKGYQVDTDLTGKTHTDLERWRKGGLDAQLFSIWCDGNTKAPFSFANRQLDSMDAIIARNPGRIAKAYDARSLYRIVRSKRIAAMAGVEGGHMIEDKIDNIDSFYNRGVRYMTLTWNNSTNWATSAADETSGKNLIGKGLNDFGASVIKRMNNLGMIIDVSHTGEQTFHDVMKLSSKPVIASHSSVYAICPHPRNLKDEQIKAIAENGGTIQVNFYSGFLDSNYYRAKLAFTERHRKEYDSVLATGKPAAAAYDYIATRYAAEAEAMKASFELVIQHIEYIIRLVGINHVGIGSDYDGIEAPPQQLHDVSTYPLITRALLEKGYSKRDIRKILGGNFLRVLRANQKG